MVCGAWWCKILMLCVVPMRGCHSRNRNIGGRLWKISCLDSVLFQEPGFVVPSLSERSVPLPGEAAVTQEVTGVTPGIVLSNFCGSFMRLWNPLGSSFRCMLFVSEIFWSREMPLSHRWSCGYWGGRFRPTPNWVVGWTHLNDPVYRTDMGRAWLKNCWK